MTPYLPTPNFLSRHAHWYRRAGTLLCTPDRQDPEASITASLTLRPSSHKMRSTLQHAHANYGTHCSEWECSHRLKATSKDLHTNLRANVLTPPVNGALQNGCQLSPPYSRSHQPGFGFPSELDTGSTPKVVALCFKYYFQPERRFCAISMS